MKAIFFILLFLNTTVSFSQTKIVETPEALIRLQVNEIGKENLWISTMGWDENETTYVLNNYLFDIAKNEYIDKGALYFDGDSLGISDWVFNHNTNTYIALSYLLNNREKVYLMELTSDLSEIYVIKDYSTLEYGGQHGQRWIKRISENEIVVFVPFNVNGTKTKTLAIYNLVKSEISEFYPSVIDNGISSLEENIFIERKDSITLRFFDFWPTNGIFRNGEVTRGISIQGDHSFQFEECQKIGEYYIYRRKPIQDSPNKTTLFIYDTLSNYNNKLFVSDGYFTGVYSDDLENKLIASDHEDYLYLADCSLDAKFIFAENYSLDYYSNELVVNKISIPEGDLIWERRIDNGYYWRPMYTNVLDNGSLLVTGKIVNPDTDNFKNAKNSLDPSIFYILISPEGAVLTSSTESIEKIQVKLHPNPVHDKLLIEIAKKVKYRINRITGEKIIEGELFSPSTSVDVSFLHSGMYLITLITDQGNSFSKKFYKL